MLHVCYVIVQCLGEWEREYVERDSGGLQSGRPCSRDD
jgi:hypothetical protein